MISFSLRPGCFGEGYFARGALDLRLAILAHHTRRLLSVKIFDALAVEL